MSKELGTLVVVVLKARNLPDDHFYKQDVYAKLTLQGSTKKTGVDVKGGQRPEWDEELRFTVTENATQSAKKLEISCWSKESRQDTLVGKGEVDISDTLRTGEFDDWVPLSTDKGQRGDIYLEMTWFAAGPPPALSRRPSKLKPSERLSRPSHGHQSSLASIPSLPPKTNGHIPPDARRTSPKGALPPLPEENGVPNSETLPSILRPGAGRPRPASTSPHARPSEVQGSVSYPPHRSSLTYDQAGGLPGLLRPGPPNGIPPAQSTLVQDGDVPSLPATTLGQASPPRSFSSPGNFYPPPSVTPQPSHNAQVPYTPPSVTPQPSHNAQVPYTQSSIYQPAHTPQPSYIPSTTPVTNTTYIPASTPTPQSTYNNPSSPPPPAPYSPQPGPVPQYGNPSSPPQVTYGPQPTSVPQSPQYGPQRSATHNGQAPIYPSQTPVPNSAPGFVLPLWGNQPSQPPPTHIGYNAAPSYLGYGLPPGPHPPPQAYYAPPPTGRPYPYNYPPPREQGFEPPTDPAKAARYQKPLPLPDDGIPPPTHTSPTPAPAPIAATPSHHKPARSSSIEDRDIAFRAQREEEERRKKQEELDEELARKLDLELNLAPEDPPPPFESVPSVQPQRQNTDPAPGSWYRHRA